MKLVSSANNLCPRWTCLASAFLPFITVQLTTGLPASAYCIPLTPPPQPRGIPLLPPSPASMPPIHQGCQITPTAHSRCSTRQPGSVKCCKFWHSALLCNMHCRPDLTGGKLVANCLSGEHSSPPNIRDVIASPSSLLH